jgi:chromosome segregation ATPase
VKVSVGQLRGSSARGSGSVFTKIDASLAQADKLKLAQQRLLELENEVEKLREENEELASAGEIIRTRADEYSIRIGSLEKEKAEAEESHQSEVLILKGNLQFRESEMAKARLKIDELDARLKSDFKKIRVRERELENRLELVRAEKAALVQSKDDYIMDLKRKIDQLQSELDNYRSKVLELNKTIDSNQEQFKRTVRALRLALSNLEVKEENIVPFKKAE